MVESSAIMRLMRLYKRGETYYIEFERGKSRSLKTGDKAKATVIFNRLKKKWLEGRLLKLESENNISLKDFTVQYLENRKGLSPKTQKQDRVALNLLADVIGAGTPLKLINAKRMDQFVTTCLARGLKAVSINSYLSHIKSAFSTAKKWELIKSKPDVTMAKAPKRLPHFLRPEEIDAILSLAKKKRPEFHRMLTVYLWTGARRNELLDLQWKDCHLDGSEPYLILTGKGSKQRTVPALPKVVEALTPIKDVGWVFPRHNEGTITHWYKALARACGIDSHLHHMRHTAATYMIASGIPIKVVQEIMGHTNIATTNLYTHVVREHMHREMSKLKFE